jgi:hypothetical protein
MAIASKSIVKAKKKPRGRPFQKGEVHNPTGRPKDGESWAGVIKSIGEMYPDDIIEFIGRDNDLGRAIMKFPKNVQMKYLVTARVFAALMFEPTSGLWNGLMERAEGKVITPLDVTSAGQAITEIVMKWNSDDDSEDISTTAPSTETNNSTTEAA